MAKPKNPSYRELKQAVEEHPAPWIVRFAREAEGYEMLDANGDRVIPFLHGHSRLFGRIVAAINAKEKK